MAGPAVGLTFLGSLQEDIRKKKLLDLCSILSTARCNTVLSPKVTKSYQKLPWKLPVQWSESRVKTCHQSFDGSWACDYFWRWERTDYRGWNIGLRGKDLAIQGSIEWLSSVDWWGIGGILLFSELWRKSWFSRSRTTSPCFDMHMMARFERTAVNFDVFVLSNMPSYCRLAYRRSVQTMELWKKMAEVNEC